MGKAPKFRERTTETDDEAAAPKKRGWLVPVLMVVVGLLLGGGGATAWFLFLGPQAAHEEQAPEKPKGPPLPPEFVTINRLTVAMVNPEGMLTGHMSLDLKLEVKAEDLEYVKARIPMMRHSMNETLSGTTIADKNNPLLLDYDAAQSVLRTAANRALAREAVLSVQITNALPI